MSVVDVERFVADGFVKLEEAAPRAVADAAEVLSPEQRAQLGEAVAHFHH